MLDRKNKRRVSMLLNAQTVYHLNKEAEREGVSIGQIVDRLVRKKQMDSKLKSSCNATDFPIGKRCLQVASKLKGE